MAHYFRINSYSCKYFSFDNEEKWCNLRFLFNRKNMSDLEHVLNMFAVANICFDNLKLTQNCHHIFFDYTF